jgi:hypothetical protein
VIVQISYIRSDAINWYRSQGPQYPTKPLCRANGQRSGRQHAVRLFLVFVLDYTYSQISHISVRKVTPSCFCSYPAPAQCTSPIKAPSRCFAFIPHLAPAMLHIPTRYAIAQLGTPFLTMLFPLHVSIVSLEPADTLDGGSTRSLVSSAVPWTLSLGIRSDSTQT